MKLVNLNTPFQRIITPEELAQWIIQAETQTKQIPSAKVMTSWPEPKDESEWIKKFKATQ